MCERGFWVCINITKLKNKTKGFFFRCNLVKIDFIKLVSKKVSFRNRYRSQGIGIENFWTIPSPNCDFISHNHNSKLHLSNNWLNINFDLFFYCLIIRLYSSQMWLYSSQLKLYLECTFISQVHLYSYNCNFISLNWFYIFGALYFGILYIWDIIFYG